MSSSNNTGNGIGCGTLFFAIFLTLKLTHVIAWSWWWITAPIWVPIAAYLGFVLFAMIAVGLAALLSGGR